MNDSSSGDAPKISEKKVDALVKLRPTLFVAIGGTGMEVLLRVRRRLLNAMWAGGARIENLTEFPVAQFVQFDLDQGAIIESGRAQQEDLQFDLLKFQEEEKLVESFDLEKYSRDDEALSRFPHIQEWLPLPPTKIRELKIDPTKGAGQIRALSRLYFFDKYPKIRDKVRQKLKALKAGLSRDEQLKKLGLELDSSKARVVVVGSVAGGTGSGSFLDMGWLCSWLARDEVGAADVDLMLFLPTGFAGANKDRTEGNGYAALMELESVMRGEADYVKRWDTYDNPTLPLRPYGEVYLIDSGNLGQQHTSDQKDVYHMVADALFEDFASADFANRKRSIAVNQQQHKILPFSPPLPAQRFGDMKLAYSRSFSAFGQSVLDTQIKHRREERAYATAAAMLKAFFGVANGNDSANRATDKVRDEFMATHLHLRPEPFNGIPEFSSKDAKLKLSSGDFLDYSVVDVLLKDRIGSMAAAVEQRVANQLTEVEAGFKPDEWPQQIRERVKQLERDVVRDQDSGAETTEDRVARRRRELFNESTRVLRDQLFAYLDNRDYGGLEFVLSLVEQIKDRLEKADSGICAVLEKNASRYDEIKEAVRTHEFERLMTNLGQTKGGFLGGLFNGGETQAREILGHIRKEVSHGLTFHLRAKAAREAAELMRQVSRFLGQKQGVDGDGQTQWDGLVGELQAGRQAVLAMLAGLDRSAAILGKDIATEHATLITVPFSEPVAPTPSAATLREWADEAFKDLGGSQALFRQLAEPATRSTLMLKVVRMAERQSALPAAGVSSNPSDPLIEALEQCSPAERQRLFKEWVARSMPWIDANIGRDFSPSADQYKCFIGVARADVFEKKFREELNAAVPTFTGMTAAQIGVFETGVPGRAVCYTELSGIPLTILRGLEAWRTSYRKESERIPAHTHIDITRFSHPISPSTDELNRLADDFRYYLIAVMVGVLERVRQRTNPVGQYQFAVARGDFRRIGNERAVRLNGLPAAYRSQIVDRVNEVLDGLDAELCATLASLAEVHARQVYAPKLVRLDTGAEDVRVGFASAMALEASRYLRDLAFRKGATEKTMERAREALDDEATLQRWTDPVPESDVDAYEWEVREPVDPRHPRLKHVLKRDAATESAILAHFRGGAPSQPPLSTQAFPGMPPAPASPGVPPPLQAHAYHIAVAGQTYGPYPPEQILTMIQNRQIDPLGTQVWRSGFAAWMLLAQCSELMPAPPVPSPGASSSPVFPPPPSI